jgi:hypothetical protein
MLASCSWRCTTGFDGYILDRRLFRFTPTRAFARVAPACRCCSRCAYLAFPAPKCFKPPALRERAAAGGQNRQGLDRLGSAFSVNESQTNVQHCNSAHHRQPSCGSTNRSEISFMVTGRYPAGSGGSGGSGASSMWARETWNCFHALERGSVPSRVRRSRCTRYSGCAL